MTGWLIDTVLYTGLLIGLVLVLRRPAGRYFGPQFAYALWALPFLRLLLPPVVLPASLAPEPVAAPAAEWVPAVASASAEPVAAVAAAPVASAAPAAAPVPPAWEWADLIAPAASIWAGVALAFLAWRIVTYRRMRRELLKGARPVGEIGKVRLVETPALAAPVAFGVLDKVIALPPLFMAQPDIVGRDLAIEHEFAHHKGHDLLANFAAQALLALHWFNPLAWYGWRAMRRDQEAACDARVLAGRGREERVRYAALIAGVATGPRPLLISGALAAPMACPILGERSIVHRLRSISMSETSRRRRWLGRSLIATGALALPLTASISYASASAQEAELPPAVPEAPLPPSAVVPPPPPAAPAAPEAPEAEHREVRTFVVRRDGESAQGEQQRGPQVREFTFRRNGDGPMPPMPQFHAWGDPADPEFEARMEEWSAQMEKWGRDLGERYADAGRNAPEVVQSCDEGSEGVTRSQTQDGRTRIVICERRVHQLAENSLRRARDTIARNPGMSEEVRREVLRDLDQEIARMEREHD